MQVDAGNALLTWQSDSPVRLVLRSEGKPSKDRVLYSGPKQSYFLSGLANGRYRLRLHGQDGSVADELALSVRHQSLSRALWLAALGAFVTLLVIGAILRGARDD